MGQSFTHISHEGKVYKTYADLIALFLINLKRYTELDPEFNELQLIEIERKWILPMLEIFEPTDNESTIFKMNLNRYLTDYLEGRKMAAEAIYPFEDTFSQYTEWLDSTLTDSSDRVVQKKLIESEIKRLQNHLIKIATTVGMGDRVNKHRFSSTEKILAMLREKLNEYDEIHLNQWRISGDWKFIPFHNFNLLKEFRLKMYEERKEKFIAVRSQDNLQSSDQDIEKNYMFWLEEELHVIDKWLSSYNPNGHFHKSPRKDSERIEILRYKGFIQNEIDRSNGSFQYVITKDIRSRSQVSTVVSDEPVNDFFNRILNCEIPEIEIHNTLERITGFQLLKLEIVAKDFEYFLCKAKDDRQSEFTKDDIQNAIDKLTEKGSELPYLILDTPTVIKGKIIDRIINVEKLLFPHDFFCCYQFKTLLKREIEKRKLEPQPEMELPKADVVDDFPSPPASFDNILSLEKAQLILRMLDDLSIISNGKYVMSRKRTGSVLGIVEVLRKQNILPQLSIEELCSIVAKKISMPFKGKLNMSDTSKKFIKIAEEYLRRKNL